MPLTQEEQLEADVPALAVKALTAAQRRAAQAGHPQVLVRDGRLVQVTPTGTTELRTLGARRKVAARRKSIGP
jgi:hypothetical protein